MNVISIYGDSWRRLQDWRQRLPHALLLSGPRGLGKGLLAQAFAASLLCEQVQADGKACGACLACHWFEQGNHPDFRMLQPAAQKTQEEEGGADKARRGGQQITIDQVRELDDFFGVGTHRQGLRIILVNPAETLNRSAANAILKVLEEPPPGTLFLLVSSEPMRLLPTLRSRCQALPITRPPAAIAQRALQEEGVENPEVWLALAGGAPGLAQTLASTNGTVWLDALIQALSSGSKLEVIATATALDKALKAVKGENPLPQLVDWSQKWLVDLSLASQGLPTRFYLRQRARIETLSTGSSLEKLVRFYRQLVKLRRESEHPLNARLFLEQFLFGYRALFVE